MMAERKEMNGCEIALQNRRRGGLYVICQSAYSAIRVIFIQKDLSPKINNYIYNITHFQKFFINKKPFISHTEQT